MVQSMPWHRKDYNPLSETARYELPTHTCVARELIINWTRQKKILPFRYRLFLFLVNFSCIKITSYSIWIDPCIHFIDTFPRQKLCHHCPRQRPAVPTAPSHYMSNDAFNSSPPSSAYMRQWTGSALAQTMSWHLIGAKPPTEPMLVNWTPRDKLQWKCSLGNDGHLSSGGIS